jgi:hypothetical protein
VTEIPHLNKGQVLMYIEENLEEDGFFTVSTPDSPSQIAILQEEDDEGIDSV